MDAHIRMPKTTLDLWLSALRNDEYEQTTGALEDEVLDDAGEIIGNAYCCLGVLQMVVDGQVELNQFDAPEGLPTQAWLKRHGIEFMDSNLQTARSPYLAAREETADGLNDMGVPFAAIADAIEAEAEVY